MMTDSEFALWRERLAYEAPAVAEIQAIRNYLPTLPARAHVGSRVRYASVKMGFTLEFDRRRLLLPVVETLERSRSVREFYPLPPPIQLNVIAASGRPSAFMYRPDLFVLADTTAHWEEWRHDEEEMRRLAEKAPGRYLWDEERDAWRCPPGERYAERFGLTYRVRLGTDLNPTNVRNLEFLADYLTSSLAVSDAQAQWARSLLSAEPGFSLAETLARADDTADVCADTIYALIAARRIFVDLDAAPLAEPHRVRLFRDETQAEAYALATAEPVAPVGAVATISLVPGACLLWDGVEREVLNAGERTIALRDPRYPDTPQQLSRELIESYIRSGAIRPVVDAAPVIEVASVASIARNALASMGEREDTEAIYRFHVLSGDEPPIDGEHDRRLPPSLRTRRRWKRDAAEAERQGKPRLLGLYPHTRRRGNRGSRLDPRTRATLDEWIKTKFENPRKRRKMATYRMYYEYCQQGGIPCVSSTTFWRAIALRPRGKQIRAREGARAAYQHEFWLLEEMTPPHGDFPLHIVHFDHTQLDIMLRDDETGEVLGKPYLSLAVDAYTRRILAMELCFDAPSTYTCLRLFRDLVRRYQRMPFRLILDNGPEFHSIALQKLAALYGCTIVYRPPAKPRAGSVIERVFKTNDEQLIHNLAGNTQLLRNPRQLTPAVDPRRLAEWTLTTLYCLLEQFLMEVYDQRPHPALGRSPRDMFARGRSLTGMREQKLVPFDRDFLFLTLASTRKGYALVQPADGVKINGMYYWSTAMRDVRVERTSVEVRFDFDDISVASALIRDRWEKCHCRHMSSLQGYTDRERALASKIWRGRMQTLGVRRAPSEAQLASLLLAAAENEDLLAQHRKSLNAARLRRLIPQNGVTLASMLGPNPIQALLEGATPMGEIGALMPGQAPARETPAGAPQTTRRQPHILTTLEMNPGDLP